MRKNKITVLDQQTIFDIAVQEYGNIEHSHIILEDNPHILNFNNSLTPGEILRIRPDTTTFNNETRKNIKYYKENSIKVVTKDAGMEGVGNWRIGNDYELQ